MTKEKFIKYMTELVAIKSSIDKLNKAVKDFEPDFNYLSFGRIETLIVKVLEIAMDDKAQWISWWLYENECGKGKMQAYNTKHKLIPSKTINNLYNLIKIK